MSKPHPSMALTLDLDESIVDHELRLEIDRCYSYLGTPVVRTHEGEGGELVNTLRMTVRVESPRVPGFLRGRRRRAVERLH